MGIKGCSYLGVLFDILLYLTVLTPVILSYCNLLTPLGGSFNCDDSSIRFPYQGDTVSSKILFCIIFIPVIIIVFTTEVFQDSAGVCKGVVLTTVNIFLRFLVFLTLNLFLNMVIKIMTAVPRPHFLATCQPRWGKVNCSAYGGNVDIDLSYLCQGYEDDPDSAYDSIKSFPSGHAQLSCFAAAFNIVYLHRRLDTKNTFLLKHWLQLVLVVMAIFSSTSRVADHRHHVMDVVVGGAIGAIIGAMAALETVSTLLVNPVEEIAKKEAIENESTRLKIINIGCKARSPREQDNHPGQEKESSSSSYHR